MGRHKYTSKDGNKEVLEKFATKETHWLQNVDDVACGCLPEILIIWVLAYEQILHFLCVLLWHII